MVCETGEHIETELLSLESLGEGRSSGRGVGRGHSVYFFEYMY